MTSGTLQVSGTDALDRPVRFPGEPMRLRLEGRFPAQDELPPAGVGSRARIVWSPTRSILPWGGVGVDGHPFLEPAFVVNAPRARPDPGGAYETTGLTSGGRELFTLGFDAPVLFDGDGGLSFAFALPERPG